MVTCAETGSVDYPALISDGYTTTAGQALLCFGRATVSRIAADLEQVRAIDVMPAAYPILRLRGDDLAVLDGNALRRQIDRLGPCSGGYFALGARQWAWDIAVQPSAWRGAARRLLTWRRDLRPGPPPRWWAPDRHASPLPPPTEADLPQRRK